MASSDEQAVIVVKGPTVVAFCAPLTENELEENPDSNEVLADFQLYAGQARVALKNLGIEFHEVYARSFQLSIQRRVITFRPGEVDVGYYIVRPGKKPRIESGVMTDDDLLHVAKEYFGISAK